MRFGTYNVEKLFGSGTPVERTRHELVYEVIRDLDVDVLAIQEVAGTSPEQAAQRLVELGHQVGLTAYHREPLSNAGPEHQVDKIAVGISPHDLHLGLLWNPERVEAVEGSFRSYPKENMHHGLIKMVFRVLGSDGAVHQVQHGSTHLTPFDPHAGRADEAVRVASAFTRPLDRPPGLVGGDWNTTSADRVSDGTYYDPDPYADFPWNTGAVFQCQRERDERGRVIRWWADRTPGEALLDGGLLDARVELHNATLASGGVPWQASAGHRSTETTFGPRRIDGIRCTADVVPALRRIETVADERTRRASDHLPEVLEYDPAAISREHRNPDVF